MDQQTIEIAQALRRKVTNVSAQLESSSLAEFYDPKSDRAKLKRSALAGGGRTTAKKPEAQAAPAAPAGPKSDAEKQSLAKIVAANKEAEAKKSAKPEPSAAKQALLHRIKKMINQSIDDVDVPALIEDMELYLGFTEATDETHGEVLGWLKSISAVLVEQYELDEAFKAKLEKWIQE